MADSPDKYSCEVCKSGEWRGEEEEKEGVMEEEEEEEEDEIEEGWVYMSNYLLCQQQCLIEFIELGL